MWTKLGLSEFPIVNPGGSQADRQESCRHSNLDSDAALRAES